MKTFLLSLLLTSLFRLGLAQAPLPASSPPHIRIVLIGTFHFGATLDRNRTSFPNLFSARRQAELQALATQLAALHPDKVLCRE